MAFNSVKEIIDISEKENKLFWEVILESDMRERLVSKEESMNQMKLLYDQMKETDRNYDKRLMSNSKLSGGDGQKIKVALAEGKMLSGNFIGTIMKKAIKTAESNACMKRIVAAPTAGSCGVVPSVLLTYQEQYDIPDEKMLEALYVSSGIGQVIAERASISGAEGGCQAEIGSASAMTAGAIAYLQGGDNECISNASAFALKSLLGLVCDPVAGLVEVPCVKRNVIGAVNAVTSADMAIAGVKSKIPLDEVIDAMRSVGDQLPETLRETSGGGLAVTPTGIKIAKDLER